MEYVNFYERIKNVKNLNQLSEEICRIYNLGNLLNYKHIEVGYEDFNMIIESEKGKYFAKLLNKSRPQKEKERLVNILEKSIENGVTVPKIYKIEGEAISKIVIENKEIDVILMDYIDGKNMLFLNRDFTHDEIKKVAKEMAIINKIDYSVEAYYDEWTITNFESEYQKKIDALDDPNKLLVTRVYKDWSKVDFSKLKKTYIHGDIIKSNLILDKSNKIWVIDFSVLNYLPRVIELAVSMFGICLTNDRKQSIENMNILLKEYTKYNNLDKYEIQMLPIIFNLISAMNVLQTAYIKNTDESFEENEYWLSEGVKGINLNLSNSDITYKKKTHKITKNSL